MDVKHCSCCAKTLPTSEFASYKASNGKFYLRSRCIECNKLGQKDWKKANAARVRKYGQEYRAQNKVRHRALSHMSYGLRKYGNCDCCSRDDILQFVLNRPDGMVIDHIKTALEGGKHCLFNLQYMTVNDHAEKSAKERIHQMQP